MHEAADNSGRNNDCYNRNNDCKYDDADNDEDNHDQANNSSNYPEYCRSFCDDKIYYHTRV